MPLAPGTRIGPYEVLAAIGAGGMGEVYRARDTRLERSVAIKVLPHAHAADPEFRSRFEREARAVAALNHPHICTIHDVGRHNGMDYLVMELIDGQTLADRLARGPMPVDEALRLAAEIADALDRAHRAGIVHRDLKPANVMVTKTGVKLLDFGLAKTTAPLLAGSGVSVLPTTPANVTLQGTILGTLQYMAPEQIEGVDVDARTDIFAFGAMLYEMVAGRKAFEGRGAASLMGAILKDQPPPITTLQPLAPRGLDRVVSTCLAKDPDDRWQSARDLVRELQFLSGAPQDAAPAGAPGTRRRVSLALASGVVILGALLGAAVTWFAARPSPPPRHVARWLVQATQIGRAPYLAISRDGQVVVYSAERDDGVTQLFVRNFDQLEATPIRGTERARGVAFAPDAASIAFVDGASLKKISLDGGPATVVCAVPREVLGLAWSPGNAIVFGSTDGLYRVSAGGGTPERVTSLDASRRETSHGWPIFMPDGDTVAFTAIRGIEAEIALVPLSGGTSTRLIDGTSPRVTSEGDLLFSRGLTLWGVRLDPAHRAIAGDPVPLLESITNLLAGYSAFDVSADGTLVYLPRHIERQQLSWVDRSGKATAAVNEQLDGIYHGPPALSPDGRRMVVSVHPQGGADRLVIYDLERGIRTLPASLANTTSRWPVWTPDGSRLTFGSEREGTWDIFEMPASGAGAPQPLLVAPGTQAPSSWSRGGVLAFGTGDVTSVAVSTMTRGGRPAPLSEAAADASRAEEIGSVFSPDGRWLAYASDESGRFEILLRAYPGPSDPIQVSPGGGRHPHWSPDGRELIYIAGLDRFMSVPVRVTSPPVVGAPTELFRLRVGIDGSRPYTIAPDGRFLVIQDTTTTPPSIAIVQNWLQELRQKLP
jgi:serine/threonine-protein kinase